MLKLLQARESGGAFVGLFLTLVGGWLQAEELNLIHVSLRDVWPLGLVLFGVYLVWQGLTTRPPVRRRRRPEFDPLPPIDASSAAAAGRALTVVLVNGRDTPRRTALRPSSGTRAVADGGARGRQQQVDDDRRGDHGRRLARQQLAAFRGADLIAVMGGCEIDLRQAAINGEAVIDVFCMWGGIEIRVPEDWTVVEPRSCR